MNKRAFLAATIAFAAFGRITAAQSKGPPDDNPGRGWGVGGVPPGHAKRYARGDRLPDDGSWIVIRDPDRYGLPRSRDGEVYVRIDDQVVRAARDTATVIEAIGIVGDLLN